MIDLKYIAAVKASPGAYNDIEITADGDIATVDGSGRVKQDVVKILLTEVGLMPYPNYGSSLPLLPGNTPYSPTLLNLVASEVESAIHYLTLVEDSPEDTERISEIRNLEVSFDTDIHINFVIRTLDTNDIVLGFSL